MKSTTGVDWEVVCYHFKTDISFIPSQTDKKLDKAYKFYNLKKKHLQISQAKIK